MMLTKQIIKEHLNNLNIRQIQSVENELEFQLWSGNEIEELNENYEVERFLSGYLGIGSNGGGEMLAIELETGILWSIPFVPMNISERIKIASNLNNLHLSL